MSEIQTEANVSVTIRKADERGHADFGWLKSRHTFSFGDYQDADHMGFRSLRVINEDRVAANGGFETHPHKNMEIFSYVLEGELEHKDSMRNGRVLKPGQIQLMFSRSGSSPKEIGAPQGGERSAIIYTILESCKRRGIHPGDYLRDVLSPLPTMLISELQQLTLANWVAGWPKDKLGPHNAPLYDYRPRGTVNGLLFRTFTNKRGLLKKFCVSCFADTVNAYIGYFVTKSLNHRNKQNHISETARPDYKDPRYAGLNT